MRELDRVIITSYFFFELKLQSSGLIFNPEREETGKYFQDRKQKGFNVIQVMVIHDIMQFHKPGDLNPAYGVREYWDVALNSPGASQMKYLKQLILSRSYFDRVPDGKIVAGAVGEKYDYKAATRGRDYSFIYTWNGSIINARELKHLILQARKKMVMIGYWYLIVFNLLHYQSFQTIVFLHQ